MGMGGFTGKQRPHFIRRLFWFLILGAVVFLGSGYGPFFRSNTEPVREAPVAGDMLPGGATEQAMERIGQRLVALSPAAQLPLLFQFKQLNSRDLVNAVAMPGGKIFVSLGLLERIHTEGELAAVLSHEIGHLILNAHGGGAGSRPDLWRAETRPAAASAAPTPDLEWLAASRDAELQADFIGMCILARAGYDPADMLAMVEIFRDAAVETHLPERLSTHPNPAARLVWVKQQLDRLDDCPQILTPGQ